MKLCMGCMKEYDDALVVCPECGLESDCENDIKKHLKCGTLLNSRFLIGRAQKSDDLFITYIARDNKDNSVVSVDEYFPQKTARRVTGQSEVVSNSYETQAEFDAVLARVIGRGHKLADLYALVPSLGILACIEENSTVYIVSEVKSKGGKSLAELFGESKRVTLPVALNMFEDVLTQLDILHEQELTHGGICLENIFVGESGRVLMLGCSLDGEVYADLKEKQSPYAAPEVLSGDETGPWSDIYAAAAVIYRLLMGEPVRPDGGEEPETLWQNAPEDIPQAAKDALTKALRERPVMRTRSATELLEALAAAQAGQQEDKKTAKKKNGFVAAVFPVKGDPKGEVVRKLVLILSIITMIVSTGILINTYVVEPAQFKSDTVKTSKVVIEVKPENESAAWAKVKEKYPDVKFPQGMQAKFAELYVINKDIIGWLSIPSFEMNFPIVKTVDNNAYLRHNFYGKWTKYGVPFADYRNTTALLDRNTILYGHNMEYDDLIFGMLENYRMISGFKSAPTIEFDTIYENHKWKVYGVFVTNSEARADNGYAFNYIFTRLDDDKFMDYIKEVDKRKLYTTGVDIEPTDKILTLSTCCYDFNEARLVVVARLVRDGESEEVDTSKAVINNNPRYPQAWYDANAMENPYKNDTNWFVQ